MVSDIDTTGLEESVLSHKGSRLTVITSYGWGWTHDGANPLGVPDNFQIVLKEFWRYMGKLRGGFGPIVTENHPASGMWCVFSTRHSECCNFTDKLGQYNIQIGKGKPRRNEQGWPLFSNSTLHHGYGEVRLDEFSTPPNV